MTPTASTAQPPQGSQAVLVALAVAGAAAFVYGIMQPQPTRAWGMYLVNLLFWSSLAITGPALAGEGEADRADHGRLPADLVRPLPDPLRRPVGALPVGDDACAGEGGLAQRALHVAPHRSRRGAALLGGASLLPGGVRRAAGRRRQRRGPQPPQPPGHRAPGPLRGGAVALGLRPGDVQIGRA